MPKIIGGSLSEHRSQTRHKLFAALATLMAERGFESITLADIAARAGVGRTAVYNHVADKDALLIAFIAHETEQFLATLDRSLAGIDDPVEQLRVYVRQNIRLRSTFQLAPGPDLRSVVRRPTRDQLGDHVDLVEAVLRRILEAGVAARVFADQDLDVTVPLVNACLRSHVMGGDATAERGEVEQTEEFVLRAVGAPGRGDGADAG